MISIWKYPIQCVGTQIIELPEGAEILTAQLQREMGRLCLWVKVDTEKPKVIRSIRIYGTGHPIEQEKLKYISTYQVADGMLVFHVFEEL